jgi:ribulose-5-phosphate 4-epimerase/fuculose-1-phosphate aldolase
MSDKAKNNLIFDKIRKAGAAILRIDGNNTHSGNISLRDPENQDLFHITASGSQTGALIKGDIVPLYFSGVSWGDARASSESTIHRQILLNPGVKCVVHAHYISMTSTSFDTKDKEIFLVYQGKDEKNRAEFALVPVDVYGANCIGSVTVATYIAPVGSAEMEERIPRYLTKDKMTIVKGHGPFARGASIEEVVQNLSILENSATLLVYLRRRGIDISKIQKALLARGSDAVFPISLSVPDDYENSSKGVKDQSIIEDFTQRLNYNYNFRISAYGTGSMSQKINADQFIYCPLSSVPEGFDFALTRESIRFEETDSLNLKIHKLIYKNTNQTTCMITTNPMATAEGMVCLHKQYGVDAMLGKNERIAYGDRSHPVILPIDAEATYLNPKLGLVDPSTLNNISKDNPILNMLRWYKGCCVVAGFGVISTGQTTLEQAAHNASSAERIARFRNEVFINSKLVDGPEVEHFEP